MKNFAITGVAGYIAPRHLIAIKDTHNNLVAAADPHDSVGILDRYFPDTSFFTEYERFDRYLEMLRRTDPENQVKYLAICSPNHLHDAHIRLALRIGADAICEKPLVLNPWNLDALEDLEKESGKKVYNVLQLRVHPSLIKLKEKIDSEKKNKKHQVTLTYITSRGMWYNYSWKGVIEKSGGIATNIGVHFFDLLIWYFGATQHSEVHLSQPDKIGGYLELENAEVQWYLSLDKNDLPKDAVAAGKTTHRSILIDGDELEFTEGFTDLHTKIYENILSGNGFGIKEARTAIETVYNIRNMKPFQKPSKQHPMVK
ncbi:MAG: Gfo/Idh/MocA family oxidoreductase [Ignavibacteriaceae bacterium]